MARKRILIVEDDPDITELLAYNLAKHGYQLTCTDSGAEAIRIAKTSPHDLVVLDLMLPDTHGLAVCQALRADPQTRAIAIVIVTAKHGEESIVAGLEAGADDYVTKPFSPQVLAMRIQAVLRRRAAKAIGDAVPLVRETLVIDPGKRQVVLAGTPIELTSMQFDILNLLARRPGWVFTRAQINSKVQGAFEFVSDRAIDVHVVAIRHRLGPGAAFIETVRGVGYRFKPA